jgi:hypothetical protein
MSSKDPKAVFFAHSARASAAVRFRKTCSFENSGRRELSRFFDRQKSHERTPPNLPACSKDPKAVFFAHSARASAGVRFRKTGSFESSGRRELSPTSSSLTVDSLLQYRRISLLENVFRKCHLFEKIRKVTVPEVNNIKSFHPKR